jgi:hypothetical protein
MAKEIFDQERPRSAMARRLDEAFAGCDQWTLAPPVRRRRDGDLTARAAGSARLLGHAAALPLQESEAL